MTVSVPLYIFHVLHEFFDTFVVWNAVSIVFKIGLKVWWTSKIQKFLSYFVLQKVFKPTLKPNLLNKNVSLKLNFGGHVQTTNFL